MNLGLSCLGALNAERSLRRIKEVFAPHEHHSNVSGVYLKNVAPSLNSLEALRATEEIKWLLTQNRRNEANQLMTRFVNAYCIINQSGYSN